MHTCPGSDWRNLRDSRDDKNECKVDRSGFAILRVQHQRHESEDIVLRGLDEIGREVVLPVLVPLWVVQMDWGVLLSGALLVLQFIFLLLDCRIEFSFFEHLANPGAFFHCRLFSSFLSSLPNKTGPLVQCIKEAALLGEALVSSPKKSHRGWLPDLARVIISSNQKIGKITQKVF